MSLFPSSTPRILSGLLLAWLCGALPARAADGHDARVKARRAYQHELVALLARRGQPQALLGAALLARTRLDEGGPLGFHRLIARAAAAPGAGPAENWVRLSDCDAAAGNCPNPTALAALSTQAPDNAAVWMLRMGQAASRKDAKAARAAMLKAAHARHYDDYTGRSLRALAVAVAQRAPPPAALSGRGSHAGQVAALRTAITFGIGQAQPMPGFQWVAARCRPRAVTKHPSRRATCLELAGVLVRGSSPLARSLGLHLRGTLAPTPAARARARAGMRDLAWQVRAFAIVQSSAREDPRTARLLLKLARRGGTEMALMLAAMQALGIPPDAPPAAPSSSTKAHAGAPSPRP